MKELKAHLRSAPRDPANECKSGLEIFRVTDRSSYTNELNLRAELGRFDFGSRWSHDEHARFGALGNGTRLARSIRPASAAAKRLSSKLATATRMKSGSAR